MEFFTKGGMFMWVILTVGVVGFAIALERFLTLYLRYSIDTDSLLRNVTSAVDTGRYQRAIEICNHRAIPACHILKAGLTKANRADKEIERAMEEELIRRAPKVNQRIGLLSMFSNTATLLGLLGTIFGLIAAFKGVGEADAAVKQQKLAAGISIAMFTTAFGLIVAIPLLIAYHFLQSKANKIVDEMQEAAVTLLNHLSAQNRDKFAKKRVSRIA